MDSDGQMLVIDRIDDPFNNPVFFNYATDDAMRFLASGPNEAYVLKLDGRPSIGRVNVGTMKFDVLPEFPEDFRHFPAVAQN